MYSINHEQRIQDRKEIIFPILNSFNLVYFFPVIHFLAFTNASNHGVQSSLDFSKG